MTSNKHRPPHIYLSNTEYYITVGTSQRKSLFDTDIKKTFIKSALEAAVRKFEYILNAWVILDNHFHILIKTLNGELLSRFVAAITGKSAIELNKLNKTHGKKCWYQYWDRCIRNEADFWVRMNYTHHNPIKHGYVSRMEKYFFSSYNNYLKEKGQDWINGCFEEYPIIDFTIEEDEF